MSDQLKISAEKRTEFGKGAARRIRRADKVPAVLYGHGTDPLHVSLPGHETMLALRQINAVLTLDVEGEEHLALAKDVQRDPVRRFIEHVDLVIVRKGEKVVVDVAVLVEGEAGPDTFVSVELTELTVEAEATNIPESITVSVEGLTAGTQILASDVELPEGTSLAIDPESLVVNVIAAITEAALEAELAEAEAEAGIEQDEPEAAAEEPAGDTEE
ncbi:50S ribosomal protein L25/general stress protein Ctc [Ornithinimicrobium sufpigmenti]|uniref:50S ribosomal protein L25/general stress protein Ctc n=1 Tax=Ornithinimicrobium sufpigmenti TaxID=2508882 RepID=UPI0010367B66|nr:MULTISPECIES: 50S ribosomal protein L25/general stress protein Ctc [unclassified Ornithinimicrobium]